MVTNISILGFGWLGKSIGERFISYGDNIKISTTSESKHLKLKNSGLTSFIVNVNTKIFPKSFFQSRTLIITIPPQELSSYKTLILRIQDSPVENVILISSTSVYSPSNKIISEESDLKNSSLVQIEKLFSESPYFKTTIIRFGGLFGANRHPGKFFKNRILINPEHSTNMIHQSDCVRIIEQVLVKNKWGEIFNACAPTHPTKKNFYSMAAVSIGEEKPLTGISKGIGKTISSDKLIKVLDYQFLYPDLIEIWKCHSIF